MRVLPSSPLGDQAVTMTRASLGDGDFPLVVGTPALVFVVIGEDGEDHGPCFAGDDGNVVTHGVETSSLAGDGGAYFGGVERLEIAGNGIAVELVAEHVNGCGTNCLVGWGDGLWWSELGEARSHWPMCSMMVAISWAVVLPRPNLGWSDGYRAGGWLHDFLVEVGIVEAEPGYAGVDVVDAEMVEGEVGGGVVADDDHEGEDIFEGEGEGGIEEGEDAGAVDGFAFGEGDFVVPGGFSGADLLHGFVEDGELDDGGGGDGLVRVRADGVSGVELDGVEGYVAMV